MLVRIIVAPNGIVMDVIDSHPLNALPSIDVTDDGMVIDARLLQLQKANVPIDMRFDVTSTVFKLIHPLNAYLSMEDTPS